MLTKFLCLSFHTVSLVSFVRLGTLMRDNAEELLNEPSLDHQPELLRAIEPPPSKLASKRLENSQVFSKKFRAGSSLKKLLTKFSNRDILPIGHIPPMANVPPDPVIPRLDHLSSQKRIEIKNNWTMNQDQLVSLWRDSEELSAMNMELRMKSAEELRSQSKPHPFTVQKWIGAIEALEGIHNQLAMFKQLRIFELGKIDLRNSNLNLMDLANSKDYKDSKSIKPFSDLPDIIISQISKKMWKNFGDRIVNDLKSLIIENRLFFNDSIREKALESTTLLWWQCALKTIDFLFKNEFASLSTIRSLFQKSDMIKQVIRYTSLRFKDDIADSIEFGSSPLTEHWDWPLLHDFFKALSKKEEDIINAYVLLEFRFLRFSYIIKWNSSFLSNTPWIDFLQSDFFSSYVPKYLKELSTPKKSKKLSYKTSRNKENFEKMIYKNVQRGLNLITYRHGKLSAIHRSDRKNLLVYICDILEFCEDLSPGIVKKVSVEYLNVEDLEYRFELMKTQTRIEDLMNYADKYHKYICVKLSMISNPKLFKPTFDFYISQLYEQLDKYKSISRRLRQRLQDEEDELDYCHKLKKIENKMQASVNILKRKSF